MEAAAGSTPKSALAFSFLGNLFDEVLRRYSNHPLMEEQQQTR
jgi:hypothetical protein